MAREKTDPFEKVKTLEAFEAPEGWVPVAVYLDRTAAQNAGLAILAMGEAYWMVPDGEAFVICVDTKREVPVLDELRAVENLQGKYKRPSATHIEEFRVGFRSFIFYAGLLIGFFLLQGRFDLADSGRIDAQSMLQQGEWWRAVTALFLHGDLVHLVSNLVAGAGFVFLVARFFGASAAWLLVLLSGAAGNALNAWVYFPEAHYAVGASTAVFAALGLITGVGVKLGLMDPEVEWSQSRWLLPALGGLTLLGMLGLGNGDGTVDVAAHFSGFICGSLLGFGVSFFQDFFFKLKRYSVYTAALSLSLVSLAWFLALV